MSHDENQFQKINPFTAMGRDRGPVVIPIKNGPLKRGNSAFRI